MDLSAGIMLLFVTTIAWFIPNMMQNAPNSSVPTIYEEIRNPIMPEAPLCRYNATLFVGDSETSFYQLQELKRLNQSIVRMHISVRNVTEIGAPLSVVETAKTPQWRRSDGVVIGTFLRPNDVKKELKCL